MSMDYSEKRNFYRMELDSDLQYKEMHDSETKTGVVKNLSADGVMFWGSTAFASGTKLYIIVKSGSASTPPFTSIATVLRSSAVEGDSGRFAIACSLEPESQE